jgi:hypothetical protein
MTEAEIIDATSAPGSGLQAAGLILMVVAFIVGGVLGDRYAPVGLDGGESFSWALAALSFAPLFVAGAVLLGASAIVGQVHLASLKLVDAQRTRLLTEPPTAR